MSSETTDFRYNTGATKVPWAAVGEDYNAQDGMYERICKSFFSDFGHKIH